MGEPVITRPSETLSGLYMGVDGTLRVEHVPRSNLFPLLYQLLGCTMIEAVTVMNPYSNSVGAVFYVDEEGAPVIKEDAVVNVKATAFANYLSNGDLVIYGDAFLFSQIDFETGVEIGLTPTLVALILVGLELATGEKQAVTYA